MEVTRCYKTEGFLPTSVPIDVNSYHSVHGSAELLQGRLALSMQHPHM